MAHQNPTMMASVTTLSPDVEEKPDTMPSEYQPPGVDEDDEDDDDGGDLVALSR